MSHALPLFAMTITLGSVLLEGTKIVEGKTWATVVRAGAVFFRSLKFVCARGQHTNFRLNGRRPEGKNELYCFDQMRAHTTMRDYTRKRFARDRVQTCRGWGGLHEIIVYTRRGRKLVFR